MNKPLLNYCLVTQNLASIIEDSAYDSDRFPDFSNINGEVIFTPNIANGKAYQLVDSDGKAYTFPVSRVQAKIVNGEITHEDETGVYLFAAGAGSNPDKITYSVEYRNLRTGDLSFSLSPIKFEAIPGGTVDLTLATPVVGATPAGIVRGPRGPQGLKFLGVVDSKEMLPTTSNREHGDAYVNIANKSLFIWNGTDWDEIHNFASVDPDVETFSDLLKNVQDLTQASIESSIFSEESADRSESAADRAEFAANETIQQVEGDFATRNYVDALEPRIDAKADASTVNDLAAVTTGITGVARRNSRRIRELVSALSLKADKASVDTALAEKADVSAVDEVTTLVVSALGLSRKNANQIKKIATGETNQSDLAEILATKADKTALTEGLATKADKADLTALTTSTLDTLEAQDADIQTAMTTASTASTTAQNAEARVAAVEAVAELAPESPVDGQTASLISQPDTLTKAAVIAAVGAAFKEDPAGSGLYTLTI